MLSKSDIARLRSLREKKQREATGQFVVEGEKVVRELIAAGFPFGELYTTDADFEGSANLNVTVVTTAEMARISHFPTPSAFFAVGPLRRIPFDPADLARGLTLALDGVQDAGNVGTLIRIADWYRIDRVLLSPDCADLFSQKVINASMGSFARVRVHTLALAPALAPTTTPVLGCDLNGDDVHQLAPLANAVLVIGSEGRGLSDAVRACIRKFVTIPRYGKAESLNAAVAAAVVCDNLRRILR